MYSRMCVRMCLVQAGHRSALRRVCERDEAAGRYLVLVVSAVHNPTSLDLSDGWYAVRATLDEPLGALVKKGSLALGTKVAVCGAELGGLEGGAGLNPLELEVNLLHAQFFWPLLAGDMPHKPPVSTGDSRVSLSVRYNSTRPAR